MSQVMLASYLCFPGAVAFNASLFLSALFPVMSRKPLLYGLSMAFVPVIGRDKQ